MSATAKQPKDKKALPEGWQWVKLEEVCSFINGDAYKQSDWDVEGIPIIRIQNLNDESKPFNYWKGSLEDRVCIKNGDLLLAWSGTPGTSFGAHIWNRGVAVLNQHIFLVHTSKDLEKSYAKWAINDALDDLIKAAHGAVGLAHVTRREVEALSIPLPPLPEQQRMAAILKEQMAAVDKARAAAQERLEAVKALPAAFLRQVFPQPGQPLPVGWRWVRLGEVCELNPRRPMFPRKDAEPTSFIPMEAVNSASGTVADLRTRPFIEVKKGYTYFSDGDVLFAKITPCMQNGKHAIAQGLIDGIGFGTTEFHVLRPSEGISSEWIHFFVRQPAFLQEATEHFTGAVGQQRLPHDYLANHMIPLPPLPEQQRIAAILNEQMAAVDKARTAAEAELETINALPAALLRRAFNGEL
ncbi:MAG: restriction endonuclease subunit S [Pseudomonadota bacterium]|nr:restriction endonuclease subunit S [Pseudomonadota bacterium]